MFAPNVNSFKRQVPGTGMAFFEVCARHYQLIRRRVLFVAHGLGYWAPTRASWAIDNRTVALRVLPGGPKGTRLETRIGGADANPYYNCAASIASGLYGIRHKLELPPPVTGTDIAEAGDEGAVCHLVRLQTNALTHSPTAAWYRIAPAVQPVRGRQEDALVANRQGALWRGVCRPLLGDAPLGVEAFPEGCDYVGARPIL